MKSLRLQQPTSRLLIVDDDPAQLHTLCRMMEYEGFDVIGCRTAAEALEQVKQEDLSVAVIDYRLPDLTGTQLLEEIRKANGRILAIIHTAYGSFESAKDAVNLGAFAYVEKASDPQEVIRHVHQAFRTSFDRYTKSLENGLADHATLLQASEEKYRILVQTMNEGLIMEDRNRRITYVNDRMCEMWGYQREELVGHAISHFFDEEANRFLDEKWASRKQGDRSSYPFQLTRKDGRVIHTIIAPQPIFDSEHRLEGIFTVITDITEWTKAKEALQQAHDHLDRRVRERTTDLTKAVERLQKEIAERKRAESQVIENSRQLHMALDALDGGIWDWNIQTGHVHFSSNWSRMLGYEPDEIEFHIRTWEDALHPNDKPRVMQVLNDYFEGRSPTYLSEHRMRTKSGDWIWVLDRGRVVARDENGKPIRMMGTDIDINTRKRSEEALQESRERFRTLVEHAPEAILLYDCDKDCFISVNENAVRLTGLSREELYTKNPLDISPKKQPDGRLSERVAKIWIKKALKGEAPVFEWTHQTSEGVLIPCEVRLVRLPGIHQRLVRASIMNISQRKAAEDRIRRQAFVFDNMYDGVLLTDMDGRITSLNPSAERMFGYSKEELLGQVPEILNLPEEAAKITQSIKSGIARDGMWSSEVTFVRKDGSRGICESFLVPLRDENGIQVGTVAVNRDVTDRKEAEKARAELEEQLRQSQKMEAVGTLASGIAHQFDNLLTAIFSYTDLAKQTLPDDHEAVRALEKVEQTARLARGTSLALLTFSHQAVFQKKIINLSDILAETVALLARLMPSSIEIVDDFSPDNDLWIKADAGQMQQVLMNLALNARDAMPNGGELRVSLHKLPTHQTPSGAISLLHQNGWVVLSVEDTGMGMSEEVLLRIFEPFYTTKPRGKGTGLGMSITHGIVEDIGGMIDVKSAIHQGTRITITLPCCQPPADLAAAIPVKRTDRASGKLIVIIERNEHVRSIMTTTLRTRGYTVTSASSIQEALYETRNRMRSIGLLIFDLDSAEHEGLARLQIMRSSQRTIPLVIMAGTLTINLNTYGIEDGLLLRKPFQMKDLVSLVSDLLSESTQRKTANL